MCYSCTQLCSILNFYFKIVDTLAVKSAFIHVSTLCFSALVVMYSTRCTLYCGSIDTLCLLVMEKK